MGDILEPFFINSSGLLWRNHKDESAVKETLDRRVSRFGGRMSLGETQLFFHFDTLNMFD